jgi:hypothetical protein
MVENCLILFDFVNSMQISGVTSPYKRSKVRPIQIPRNPLDRFAVDLSPTGSAMTQIKTKESTLRALREAVRRPRTAEEMQKQRVSFVMGSLDAESPMTREKVEKLLAEQQGLEAA